jgi:alcohol dehydrogenase class IV
MPKNIAAWTGFDALAHSFEGFVSRIHCNHSSSLALGAMKLISENLREFVYNRMNHTACENMCWAESMAGSVIMFGAGVGIVHGMADQVEALTGSHHGRTIATMTLAGERYNEATCADKFAEMAGAMGADIRGMTVIQAADRWFDEIERLLKDLGIRSGHLNEQFGLEKKDLKQVVAVYANDWCQQGNPRDFNSDDCTEIMESLF